MIHHISIPAENPQHVAEVIAKIWGGRSFPFPDHPGNYLVVTLDSYGTMIEVYALGTELVPGTDEQPVEFGHNNTPAQFSASHAAISVPVSFEQIKQIAESEGWRLVRCDRGPFEVIEFWLENRQLIELLAPEIAPQYINFMQPQNLQEFFAVVGAA